MTAPERPWDTLHTGPGMPDLEVVTGNEEGFLVRIYAEDGTFEELRVKPKGDAE